MTAAPAPQVPVAPGRYRSRLPMGGGVSTGSGPDPASPWDSTLAALQTGQSFIKNKMVFSDDCLAAFAAVGTSGSKVRSEAGSLQLFNGTTNNDPITVPLPDGTTVKTTVAALFTNQSPLGQPATAFTYFNSTSSYWLPGFGAQQSLSTVEAQILHESLHGLGFTDGQIESALGIASTNTTNAITDRLQKLCF